MNLTFEDFTNGEAYITVNCSTLKAIRNVQGVCNKNDIVIVLSFKGSLYVWNTKVKFKEQNDDELIFGSVCIETHYENPQAFMQDFKEINVKTKTIEKTPFVKSYVSFIHNQVQELEEIITFLKESEPIDVDYLLNVHEKLITLQIENKYISNEDMKNFYEHLKDSPELLEEAGYALSGKSI